MRRTASGLPAFTVYPHSPVCSVISVGEGNSYGHPTAATLERLNEYGPVYRTDLLGEIRITTDGVSLWVESDNGEPEQLL